ncbi:interferon regulatory factor 2 [Hydra vulgaris]|uniref:Interferon regulatory factor 2 n=1 Tax=Hydra vulgaris TaxID=6087 RepID=A0ABM4C6Q8_HYDVU
MSGNSSPNLFRQSLPEWLKEQIDSGKHKGVYWIDEKAKIFHVPWKHASRNGWEDDDVSLFKAWAIYTNRYKEGVDIPKPALWKTNFRCAINSHNSITFLADQGQRKGDSAHRIMKLIDNPKKINKRLYCNNSRSESESPKKQVRLTYPHGKTESKQLITSSVCEDCFSLKKRVQFGLNALDFSSEEHPYAMLRTKYQEIIESQHHVCKDNDSVQLTDMLYQIELYESKKENKFRQPNIQDLFYIVKALQPTEDSNNELSGNVKSEIENLSDDSTYESMNNIESVLTEIEVVTNEDELEIVVKKDDNKYGIKTFKIEDTSNDEVEEDVILPRNM